MLGASLALLPAPLEEEEEELEVKEGLETRALEMEVPWSGAEGGEAVFMVSRLLLSPVVSLSARLVLLVLLTMLALEGVRVRTVLTEATEMLVWSSTEVWDACLVLLVTSEARSFFGFLKLCLRTVSTLLLPALEAAAWSWEEGTVVVLEELLLE